MERIGAFGCPMDVCTMDEVVECIAHNVSLNRFTQHVVVNVAKIVHMQSDATLKRSVESCDIINIDGMGVVWGARLLGHRVPERIAGIDLFERLLGMAAERGHAVFLLGATQEVVDAAAKECERRFPGLRIAGRHHGYFWKNESEVVEKIRASGARLLFVGITSPKKEHFINKWRDQLGVAFAMGVGGSFDVMAGKVKRAPHWMQRSGLEWLFRVIQEPKRMWKRYLVTNTRFGLILLRECVSMKSRRSSV